MPTPLRCPSCSSEVPAGRRYCGDCGVAVAAGPEERTRTSLGQDDPTSGHADGLPSTSGGRFLPGAVIANRYRVVGLLGRGGMGEVYRADDLRLGRAVALKFLPGALEHDAERRARLVGEVRTALQVTHVNVCRTYDIGEYEGHHFISMEYVDGEDLRSLLRRIGRVPQDKALQIARQLCAGLAAAHDQDILHRDLKPANVMLDGRGQVKIMDFGLAGLGATFGGAELRAGTPAYMSPEQIEGREVTARSDVYALGLVLYELFTGKPAFDAATVGEVSRLHRQTAPTQPSSLVERLDPAVERVILRCLAKEPHERPGSARAVVAALPGGDPLAAALAAGETPSPELVADAGAAGGLAPRVAWAFLGSALVAVVLSAGLEARFRATHGVAFPRTPELLTERARETLRGLGYESLPHAESGFTSYGAFVRHVERTDRSVERWAVLHKAQPAAVGFWYRESPAPLDPLHAANVLRNYDVDPAFTEPGMAGVQLDLQGRLLRLDAVPPDREPPATATPQRTDWPALLRAAGLSAEALVVAEPTWNPPSFADERAAWTGSYPEAPEVPIRVEAAAYRGRLVGLRILAPWDDPSSVPDEAGAGLRASAIVDAIFPVLTILGAGLLAWRNLRLGRSDRRGAFRLAAYLFAVRLLIWAFETDRYNADAFHANLAWSLYRFGTVWLFYVALEPYLRRIWPHTMVSWARLLDGRLRDPLVGRDMLLGALLAAGLWLAGGVYSEALELAGVPLQAEQVEPSAMQLRGLSSLTATISAMFFGHAFFVLNAGFFCLVFLLLLRIVLRRTWIAVLGLAPVFLILAGGTTPVQLGFAAMALAWWIAVLFRAGLLPLIVGLGLIGLATNLYPSLDPAAWYSKGTFLFLGIFAVVALYGFRVALAGRPAFRADLLEG